MLAFFLSQKKTPKNMTMTTQTNKYALITGASAGIGKSFAHQLAKKGWNLILVARRLDTLQALAQDIQNVHKVNCIAISQDMAEPDASQNIFDHCQQQKLNVAMLINNAGYGVPGDFEAVDWQTHSAMLQVMLNSVVELTHLFYPLMQQAKYGRIIQVASLAGITPSTAGHTLYGAVKSFLVKFGHALHLEGKDHGVHVTALCPGFTYTEFHDVNGTRPMVSKLPKSLWMTAKVVAAQGLAAVEKNQPVKINGWRNQMIYGLTKVLPDKITRVLMSSSISKFRKR